jgi:hypothetical protein
MGRFAILIVAVLGVLGFAAPRAAARAPAPSFDCAKAKSRAETAICGDPLLAEYDAMMGRLYAATKVSAFGIGPSNMPALQREWLADQSCASPRNGLEEVRGCLRYSYPLRIQELAVAALFRDPGSALPILRRFDPEGAPMQEAILLYASEPVGANWSSPAYAAKRAQMLGLLGPYAARFATDEKLVYGRDILKDEGIVTAEDALKSEKNFATFLKITSAYLGDGPSPELPVLTPRFMACAAVLRHPKLLDATDAAFGSGLDNFIMDADCFQTLPPLPALDRLYKRVQALWEKCDGSIRFAGYRSFGVSVDATRLATRAAIHRFAVSHQGRLALPKRRGIAPALIDSAVDELAAYYVRYRNAPVAEARAYALSEIAAIASNRQDCS